MPNSADTSGDFLWRKVKATSGTGSKQDALIRNPCPLGATAGRSKQKDLVEGQWLNSPHMGMAAFIPPSPAASRLHRYSKSRI